MNSPTFNFKGFTDGGREKIFKKPFLIAGKVIIVIDPSLVEKLRIDLRNSWFEEEQVDDGILLRLRTSCISSDELSEADGSECNG